MNGQIAVQVCESLISSVLGVELNGHSQSYLVLWLRCGASVIIDSINEALLTYLSIVERERS